MSYWVDIHNQSRTIGQTYTESIINYWIDLLNTESIMNYWIDLLYTESVMNYWIDFNK